MHFRLACFRRTNQRPNTPTHLVVQDALAEVSELEVDGPEKQEIVGSIRSLSIDRLTQNLGVLVSIDSIHFNKSHSSGKRRKGWEVRTTVERGVASGSLVLFLGGGGREDEKA